MQRSGSISSNWQIPSQLREQIIRKTISGTWWSIALESEHNIGQASHQIPRYFIFLSNSRSRDQLSKVQQVQHCSATRWFLHDRAQSWRVSREHRITRHRTQSCNRFSVHYTWNVPAWRWFKVVAGRKAQLLPRWWEKSDFVQDLHASKLWTRVHVSGVTRKVRVSSFLHYRSVVVQF